MPLESDADRRALLEIDGIAIRIFPAGVPIDLRGQYDEPTEEIGGTASEIEMLEGAPTVYMIYSDVSALAVGEQVHVLEGPGTGSYVSIGTVREDDGAFARISLADS